jgi:hypothetical protein
MDYFKLGRRDNGLPVGNGKGKRLVFHFFWGDCSKIIDGKIMGTEHGFFNRKDRKERREGMATKRHTTRKRGLNHRGTEARRDR